MDSVVGLVIDHAANAARRVVEASRVERDTGMADEHWWHVYGPLLGTVVDRTRYPMAARVGAVAGAAHGIAQPADYMFDFGLQRLLDGIDVFIRSRAGRPCLPGQSGRRNAPS
jgi:hypothetical protein